MTELKWLETIKNTNGAVALTECIALDEAIRASFKSSTSGLALDLGSHAGRSSLAAVCALSKYKDIIPQFYMIDLVYNLKNPEWQSTTQGDASKMPWGYARDDNFKRIVESRVSEFTDLDVLAVGMSSREYFFTLSRQINYVFIDSDDHQPELVMFECKQVDDFMNPGGLIFFHDFKNQYKGPAEAYRYLLATGRYEVVNMDWDGAVVKAKKYGLDNLKDDKCWHMPAVQYPTFVGCLRRV